MIIQQPRILQTLTSLDSEAPVVIAAARSAHGQDSANRIHRTLQDMGVRSELHHDPAGEILRIAAGPVVVVGNLADSLCVRMLYFNSLCATDRWYPGPAGYELRTLCDPFGSGYNVILAGYSDAEGARAGCDEFVSRLDGTIPHLKDLKITQLPMAADEVVEYRNEPLPDTDWEIANTMQGDHTGYLYYLTGEPELGEAYRKAWRAVVTCGYDRNERIVQTHLFSLSRFLPWRLVEDTDLFSEEERLAITRFFHGWAESEEGWRYVAGCRRVQSPDFPRQNHELIPAMTLTYVADYFETHFPGVTGPETWRETGRRVYEPYGSSWKPLCDGLCHGWWMSQPVMLEYALRDPAHRYFEEGGARHAAECAMAVVNNTGWLPTAGDCDLRRQFPGPSLRVAAAYYGEGRYRYVHDLASPDRQFAFLTTLSRAFDTGVESRVPEDLTGVTVVPVDPLVYHAWDRDPEVAPLAVRSPPGAPIDRCFDKLSLRTGWELEDDFLLIDGLGGGSHSYDDAAGILEYARLGVSLIVQEDSFVQSAPEHHSVVTVVRDGEAGVIPGFAILEADETSADGVVYLRIRLKEYAGADWIREVHLFPGRCAVFVDTVKANCAGNFAIEAHFRTPTRLKLEGREASGRRKSPCVEWVDVRLESLSEPSQLSTTEEPVHLRYQKARDQQRWRDRYHSDEMLLTSFAAREATHLEPGESVRLAHLVQGAAPGETVIHLSQAGNDILVTSGEFEERLRLFEINCPGEGASSVSRRTEASGPGFFFDARDKVTSLLPLGEGAVAVGNEAGTLSLVDGDGDSICRVELEGPIRDIAVVREPSFLFAAGHGPASLTGVNREGECVWSTCIERDPCPWPWWELPTPAAVSVAGGVSGGEPFFAVGCGDIQVRCFDGNGHERWRRRYNEGVPGRVRVADVEGSGTPRIVVGGDILSDQSTCRILQPDGDWVAELPVEGWTSMMTALAFGESSGSRPGSHLIACGASRGANLHLFEHRETGWERSWMRQLGGQVTGIQILGADHRVVVGTS